MKIDEHFLLEKKYAFLILAPVRNIVVSIFKELYIKCYMNFPGEAIA